FYALRCKVRREPVRCKHDNHDRSQRDGAGLPNMTANPLSDRIFSPKVGIARLPSCSYPSLQPATKDDAKKDQAENSVSQALRRLADTMGWSSDNDDGRGP